ncbi:uncharacterized protein LOC125757374 [Rhipicephalus sanguineus]|uniref:uncharacterized protein LOC125757374 n=1 Tax=Rhipicephalus sanguineus TaxID=34632 RepID=UPI0020C253BC|nr:uncharacterized protein LOC125757374 [Rhipicephalus sanguineus]
MCPTDNHGGKAAKSAETHILSFIWYAANKTCMRDVADRFDLAENTVHRALQRVADYLCTLAPTVLTFTRDLEKLSRDFEKVSGVPGVVGCRDGCYIRIQCPENKIASTYVNRHQFLSTYVNRHHFLSMTWQAVCDNMRRFSDVLVGSSSKIHDSRVFRLSSLDKKKRQATHCSMTAMKRRLTMTYHGPSAQTAMNVKKRILKKTQHYVSSAS